MTKQHRCAGCQALLSPFTLENGVIVLCVQKEDADPGYQGIFTSEAPKPKHDTSIEGEHGERFVIRGTCSGRE